MPAYIDPAWEYHAGPDWLDGGWDVRVDITPGVPPPGIGFTADPGGSRVREHGRELEERRLLLEAHGYRECAAARCRTPFRVAHPGQRYCSNRCHPRVGPRTLPKHRTCRQCHSSFRPKKAVQVVCSKSCASRRRNKLCNKPPVPLARLAALLAAGLTERAIAGELGVSRRTVQRWRRRASAPWT